VNNSAVPEAQNWNYLYHHTIPLHTIQQYTSLLHVINNAQHLRHSGKQKNSGLISLCFTCWYIA